MDYKAARHAHEAAGSAAGPVAAAARRPLHGAGERPQRSPRRRASAPARPGAPAARACKRSAPPRCAPAGSRSPRSSARAASAGSPSTCRPKRRGRSCRVLAERRARDRKVAIPSDRHRRDRVGREPRQAAAGHHPPHARPRVSSSVYSTGEQDKYRTRIERTPKNTSEIYISHRGMIEVYTTAAQDRDARGSRVRRTPSSRPRCCSACWCASTVRCGADGDCRRGCAAHCRQQRRRRRAAASVPIARIVKGGGRPQRTPRDRRAVRPRVAPGRSGARSRRLHRRGSRSRQGRVLRALSRSGYEAKAKRKAGLLLEDLRQGQAESSRRSIGCTAAARGRPAPAASRCSARTASRSDRRPATGSSRC